MLSSRPLDGSLFVNTIWFLFCPSSRLYHLQFTSLSPFSLSTFLWLFSSVLPTFGLWFASGQMTVHYAFWYNNSSPCTGLIFVSSRPMWGLCLSFSMTMLHSYLLFYFEAWLTGRQRWHSCRRCGACYYAYINILINTWLAIEEIITCHHSTVWKECALLCVYARTHVCLRVSSRKYDLCSLRSSPSINEFNSSTSHLESTLLKLIVYRNSQNPHNSNHFFLFFFFFA